MPSKTCSALASLLVIALVDFSTCLRCNRNSATEVSHWPTNARIAAIAVSFKPSWPRCEVSCCEVAAILFSLPVSSSLAAASCLLTVASCFPAAACSRWWSFKRVAMSVFSSSCVWALFSVVSSFSVSFLTCSRQVSCSPSSRSISRLRARSSLRRETRPAVVDFGPTTTEPSASTISPSSVMKRTRSADS